MAERGRQVSDADRELRLECARLVAVFTKGEGDQVEKTDRLFTYIKSGAK